MSCQVLLYCLHCVSKVLSSFCSWNMKDHEYNLPLLSAEMLASFHRMLLIAPFGVGTNFTAITAPQQAFFLEFIDRKLEQYKSPQRQKELAVQWKKYLASHHAEAPQCGSQHHDTSHYEKKLEEWS